MNEFIFYTTEGTTIAPNGEDIDNMHVLGFAKGKTSKEAMNNLIKENQWIEENRYNISAIFCKELK